MVFRAAIWASELGKNVEERKGYMKVIAKENLTSDKLLIYENVKHIDFSSSIAIIINSNDENKYVQISNIQSVIE